MLTPNNGRRKLDQKPILGGDTVYLQHQDYPIEALYDRTLEEPAAALPPAQQPPALPPGDEPEDEEDAEDDERAVAFALRVRMRARTLRLRVAA